MGWGGLPPALRKTLPVVVVGHVHGTVRRSKGGVGPGRSRIDDFGMVRITNYAPLFFRGGILGSTPF